MTFKPFQAAAALCVLAACSAGESRSNAAEQGRQAARPADRPFAVVDVARFDTPWAMAFLTGSGRPLLDLALVSEKAGRLWLVDSRTGRRWPVGGVPPVKVAGQGGLGDVVVHPEFVVNHRVYLSFVEAGRGGTSGAAVGYGTLDLRNRERPALRDFRVIWRQQPKVSGDGHFSHRIAFAPDGSMFVSSGDRQKMAPAQDRSSDLGKIIHMTAEGQRIGGAFHTLGHRNVLGLAFTADGRLWANEMGPRGGDEVNLIERGRNYGWPRASYGSHYDGAPIPDEHRSRGFEEPKVWWTPSISPAGMIIYSGDLFPQWKGDILMGALSGQALIRVDVNGAAARKGDRWDMGERIREVEQGPGGEVYLLEDGGRLLRLTPA
ncbi:PQQ-dependent sugar dehydrogenase [Sphingomonas sp. GCM10030256]|uniref:PQQ-dependent sugar dehydrogenase n=1 Tax=Sphingomonas sp. GCM10030256 TaxID=3273427 RepID=UPI003622436C